MSYFYYMACSRELETGPYAAPPKTIYPSYAAYMESEDYLYHERIKASIPHFRSNPDKPGNPRKAIGQVHVFEHMRDSLGTSLYPLPTLADLSSEHKFIAAQFSLPHLYQVDGFAPDMLCKYLKPGDQLEFLSIFLRRSAPLQPPVVHTIDLQDYVDGSLSGLNLADIISSPADNTLTHIIPPRAPQTHYRIEPIDYFSINHSDIICTIYLDCANESWNRSELHRQGLL